MANNSQLFPASFFLVVASLMLFQFSTGTASRSLQPQPLASPVVPHEPSAGTTSSTTPQPQQPSSPNPPLQPLTTPPIQPFGGNPLQMPVPIPFLQPFGDVPLITSPGTQQIGECWASIMRTPNCLREIQGSFMSLRFNVSSTCCRAIVDVGANCWLGLSPLSALIAPFIREPCRILAGGGGVASTPAPPAGTQAP